MLFLWSMIWKFDRYSFAAWNILNRKIFWIEQNHLIWNDSGTEPLDLKWLRYRTTWFETAQVQNHLIWNGSGTEPLGFETD